MCKQFPSREHVWTQYMKFVLRVLVHDLGDFSMKLQEARRNHQDEVTPNPNWQNLDQIWAEIP